MKVPDICALDLIGRRVVVDGMTGAGKSTFARALAAKTGLALIHLDLLYWKPGWSRPTAEEWKEKQRAALAGDAWIADGNYPETLPFRLERADTIVVLDTPWWRCEGYDGRRARRCPTVAKIQRHNAWATSGEAR